MIDHVEFVAGKREEESPQADGGSVLTVDDGEDSPDSQHRLEMSDQEGAQAKPEHSKSTELPSEIEQGEATDPPSEVEQKEATGPPIEIDQVFEMLKNQRRRYVLEYLTQIDDQVRLGELAEQLAAWECDKEVRMITSQERKRVYVGLYQCHLPKMDDVGAISYNKPRGKIEIGPNIDFFKRYLPIEKCTTEQTGTVRSAVATVAEFFSRE